MFKVGVTGGIGSGKSIICNIFHNLGIPVYQADIEARRLMGENESIRTGLLRYFGGEVFLGEQLNRKYLADRIFSDPDARTFINSLVHPVVRADFTSWVQTRVGTSYVIEEAALLFETGAWKEFDYNILIKKLDAVKEGSGKHFVDTYFANYEFHRDFERGKISEEKFLERMLEILDHSIDGETFCKYFSSIFKQNKEVAALLPVLKMNYKLILLSNTNSIHEKYGWEHTADIFMHYIMLQLKNTKVQPIEN